MERHTTKSLAPLDFAIVLLFAKAILWLGFGIAYFATQGGLADPRPQGFVMPILMWLDALVYALIAWGIARRSRIVFLAAFPFLIMNAVLAITDQIGFFDLLVLFLDLLILALLFLASRAWPRPTTEAR